MLQVNNSRLAQAVTDHHGAFSSGICFINYFAFIIIVEQIFFITKDKNEKATYQTHPRKGL
jgi:hypothetical protein